MPNKKSRTSVTAINLIKKRSQTQNSTNFLICLQEIMKQAKSNQEFIGVQAWGPGLTKKGHKETFWDDKNVLYLDRGVSSMGAFT